jgi:hypothetical protein
MTVRLELKPEVHAGLLAQARACGLELEAYLEQVLQERSGTTTMVSAGAAEKARSFVAWARSHASTPPLSEDALRRETLIRDAR